LPFCRRFSPSAKFGIYSVEVKLRGVDLFRIDAAVSLVLPAAPVGTAQGLQLGNGLRRQFLNCELSSAARCRVGLGLDGGPADRHSSLFADGAYASVSGVDDSEARVDRADGADQRRPIRRRPPISGDVRRVDDGGLAITPGIGVAEWVRTDGAAVTPTGDGGSVGLRPISAIASAASVSAAQAFAYIAAVHR
jgi:hypothetical protein